MMEETLLQEGIQAAKRGDNQAAQQLLRQALEFNPRSIAAWLWLSSVVDTDQERRECLESVLAIDPDNQAARYGLAQLSEAPQPAPLEPEPGPPGPAPEPTEPAEPPPPKQAEVLEGMLHELRHISDQLEDLAGGLKPISTGLNGSWAGSVKMADPHLPIDSVLDTPRCRLRYPTLTDAPRMYAALRSPAFPRDVPLGQVKSLEEVEAWIKRSHSAWAAGSAFMWSIEDRDDRALLGQVTLARRAETDAWALAFWTHPECWGQGYATQAARRVLEFGFECLGAALIWAGAADWNHASIRVLEKLGMVHVSDNPQGYSIDGEPIPTREYEIYHERWQEFNR